MWPVSGNAALGEENDEDDENFDIEKSIAREIAALKLPRKQRRFSS